MSDPGIKERMEEAICRCEKIQQKSSIQWLEKQVCACEASDVDFTVLEKRREELAKILRYTWAPGYL